MEKALKTSKNFNENIKDATASKKVAVIGAGIAGLSCAYELQKAGFDVEVFEKESFVGGRMATRVKNGFAFDIGANFFVSLYKNTHKYCDELGLSKNWQPMAKGRHVVFRDGKYHLLTIKNLFSFFRFTSLSPLSRLRLLIMFFYIGRKVKGLDFFDLSSAPDGLDTANAYDYVKKIAGQEVADYTVDGFTSTYQFHRAKEISILGMLSLMSLMANQSEGFNMCHSIGGMSLIPDALAAKMKVKLSSPIEKVSVTKEGVVVVVSQIQDIDIQNAKARKKIVEIKRYNFVVFASTADATRKIYSNPSKFQKEFLEQVRYSTTVNVSLRLPQDCLSDIQVVTVPFVQGGKISEFTHEKMKGIVKNGETLVNIGLHEEFAKKIIDKSDEEIFKLVKKEFVRVCPPLEGDGSKIKEHDIQRWQAAMPKFSHGYVTRVKEFWSKGQGEKNAYLCGDYMNAPWIEGSIICGKKVARMIVEKVQRIRSAENVSPDETTQGKCK